MRQLTESVRHPPAIHACQTDEFDVFVDFTPPRVSTASLPPL